MIYLSSVKGQEITFQFNKYQKTTLLSDKESLVQIILNALLMVPGNLPSQPLKGVDIFQYLYHPMESDEMSDKVMADLQYTIGEDLGSSIGNLTVDSMDTEDGTLFLLIIHLISDSEENEEALALAIQKVDQSVHFNYSFLTDAIKNMK